MMYHGRGNVVVAGGMGGWVAAGGRAGGGDHGGCGAVHACRCWCGVYVDTVGGVLRAVYGSVWMKTG